MTHYIAVVSKDEDSAYGIWFPDVPGCFSASDEAGGILVKAVEALSLHIGGGPLPVAREVFAIVHLPEVAADLAEGAYLVAVPYVTTRHRMVRANISLDQGMLEAIDTAATERGLTRSAFLAEAAFNEIHHR